MIAAGTAAMPIDTRHTTDSEAPTTVAMTMPTPMASWKPARAGPADLGGASSATYIGTVWVAPPTAKPSTIRPSESSERGGDSEHAQRADGEHQANHQHRALAAPPLGQQAAGERADHGPEQDAGRDHRFHALPIRTPS